MSYGRQLTLYCDWSTCLSLNAGRRLPNDATSSGCGFAVVAGGWLKLGPWFLRFSPLTTASQIEAAPVAHSELGPWLLA